MSGAVLVLVWLFDLADVAVKAAVIVLVLRAMGVL